MTDLFKVLSGPFTTRARSARFDKLTLTGRCLSSDDDDHFFADITYYYKKQDIGVTVQEITAEFAECVEISDRILMEECCRVARENMKVLHFDIKKIERIYEIRH